MHRDLYSYMSGIMRHIGDDTNALGMMQMMKPLGIKAKVEVDVGV